MTITEIIAELAELARFSSPNATVSVLINGKPAQITGFRIPTPEDFDRDETMSLSYYDVIAETE